MPKGLTSAPRSTAPRTSCEGLIRAVLAGQNRFLADRDGPTFLAETAELLCAGMAADQVLLAGLVWNLDGGCSLELDAGATRGEAEASREQLTAIIRRHGRTLMAGSSARLDGGRIDPIRFGGRTIGTCLTLGGDVPSDGLVELVLETIGNVLHLYRNFNSDRELFTSQLRLSSRWQCFAALMADVVWEAGTDGRFETILPLNDRLPDGKRSLPRNLHDIRMAGDLGVAEAIEAFGSCRHLPGVIATDTGGIPCRVSAERLEKADGRHFIGTCSFEAESTAAYPQAALVEMIQRLERSRKREHRLRVEAETLLQGLRVITAAPSAAQMFDQLLPLLTSAIEAQSACVVQRNWQGRLVAAGSTDARLSAVPWHEFGPMLAEFTGSARCPGGDEPLSQMLRDGTGEDWRSVLVAPLALAHDTGWIICLHAASDAFQPQQLALTGNFAVLTAEALSKEEQRDQVVQAGKLAALGQMVAGIAHEMNQPLNTIGLAAQNLEVLLAREQPQNPSAMRKLTRILEQVNRAHSITQKMRGFARRGHGAPERFLPVDHIENAVELMKARLRRDDIRIETRCPDRTQVAFGDATRFEQVAVNLLSNAIDSIMARRAGTEPGGTGAGRVTIDLVPQDEANLDIVFRDDGAGFDETALRNAFTPFFTTKEVGKGTGLGLSICLSIMAGMNGQMRVANWEGGAEVILTLCTQPGGTRRKAAGQVA